MTDDEIADNDYNSNSKVSPNNFATHEKRTTRIFKDENLIPIITRLQCC